ncbi:MAG: NAD(P)H-dependent oxidoreductase, partial [Bacilli bacterium]|nr:NAD(P)H-dependent oxidoreductase [Bacilli bacterium]
MKLLFLDCQLRKEISRTKRIGDAFLEEAKKHYEIEVIDIDSLHWLPKSSQEVIHNEIAPKYREMAEKVASCDLLVIG